jgi:hypothetical protein
MTSHIMFFVAWLTISASSQGAHSPAATPSKNENRANIGRQRVYRLEFNTEIGHGEGRLVVKLMSFSENGNVSVDVRGTAGKPIEVRADGLEHEIKVPASFPVAAKLSIDGMPMLVMFKKGEPVYFLQDTAVDWALISANTDPRMATGSAVLCRQRTEGCPGGYVVANDPPLANDTRCPDPERTSGATAKLCYLPGKVLFKSDIPQSVEIVDWTIDGPQVRRTIPLKARQLSEAISLEYERTRPMGVRIAGKDCFLAVGQGKTWVVQIDSAGGIEAREHPFP